MNMYRAQASAITSQTKALEFYTERVSGFDQERKIFAEYEKFIKPSQNEIHLLNWDRKQEEEAVDLRRKDLERLNHDMEKMDQEILMAETHLGEMGESHRALEDQIQNLADIIEPVQHDTTYLVLDRYPIKQSVSKAKKVDINTIVKQVRSGDVVMLEGKLQGDTTKTQTLIGSFNGKVRAAVDLIGKKRFSYEKSFVPNKEKVERVIEEIEYLEKQCFQATYDLLGLRLKIMIAQREEVDELERLEKDQEFFMIKDQETRENLIDDLQKIRDQLQTDLVNCTTEFRKQQDAIQKELNRWSQREQDEHEIASTASVKLDNLKNNVETARDR